MDGLQLGDRQIKVSLAKEPPQRQQYSDNRIGLRDRPRVQPVNLLQVQSRQQCFDLGKDPIWNSHLKLFAGSLTGGGTSSPPLAQP